MYSTVQSVVTLAYAMLVFERPIGPDTNLDLMENAVWLIIITMTTVGYGDIYPQTPMGRQVAVIAALLAGTPFCPPCLLSLLVFLFLFLFLASSSSSPPLPLRYSVWKCSVCERERDREREREREMERVGNRVSTRGMRHAACGRPHTHTTRVFCSVCLCLAPVFLGALNGVMICLFILFL